MCFQARVLRSRSPKKGKKRRLTSQACNKSVFPICHGIDVLISLLLSTLLVQSNCFSEFVIGTFRSEDDDDYEFEFSVLSMRTSKNVGLQTLCACSVLTTRTRSRPRPPI